MHYLRFIFGIVFIAFITLILFIKNQPSQYKVERAIETSIPAATLYNYISDFQNWPEWNPWILEDPKMNIQFITSNPKQPAYTWEGKDGNGSMKTLRSDEPYLIEQEMDFEGFAPSKVTWEIKTESDSLHWIMEGNKGFMMKAFGLLFGSMDSMIGPYYKKGLDNIERILKAKLEKHDFEYKGDLVFPEQFFLSLSYNTDKTKMDSLLRIGSKELVDFAKSNTLNIVGPVFTILPKTDFDTGFWFIGLPIKGYYKTNHPTIKCRYSKERNSLVGIHKGLNANLEKSWEILYEELERKNPERIYYPMIRYIKNNEESKDPLTWKSELLLQYQQAK